MAQEMMNTNLMLILSAVLVITSGVSLASFMNTLGEYNVPAQKVLKLSIMQDNDNEAVADVD
jgi:hypothetical protein